MSTRFIYLVQARHVFEYFEDLVSPESSCIVLYWTEEINRPECRYFARHRSWSGTVNCYADGRIDRPGGHCGRFSMSHHSRIVVNWDDGFIDELLWCNTRRLYSTCDSAFTMVELAPGKMTSPKKWREIDFVGSTWNTGRNRLLLEAIKQGGFEYVIFMDDDAVLWLDGSNDRAAPFRRFEKFLNETRPAVGFCNGLWHKRPVVPGSTSAPLRFDACVNAVHRDALPVLLPYDERFDAVSWWWSQEIFCCVAAVVYPGRAVQCNEVQYKNLLNSSYPRGRVSQLKQPSIEIANSLRCPRALANYKPFPANMNVEFKVISEGDHARTAQNLGETFNLQHLYWENKAKWWSSLSGKWL